MSADGCIVPAVHARAEGISLYMRRIAGFILYNDWWSY